MAKKPPRSGPLSRTCPRCAAVPGAPCRSPSGRLSQLHTTRRDTPQPVAPKPGDLTPELIETIAGHLRLGVPIGAACIAAGISTTTYYRWLAQAEAADPDKPSLERDMRDTCIQARGRGVVIQAVRINQVAARHIKSEEALTNPVTGAVLLGPDGSVLYKRVWEQDWRAAAWMLERSYARDFGRREIIELSAGDGVVPVAAGAVMPGADGSTPDRIVASIAAFKARKLLETGVELGADGEPIVDAEVVDPGQ